MANRSTPRAWGHLPVAVPLAEASEYRSELEVPPSSEDEAGEQTADPLPELGCYGRFLFWMATVLSCCTITNWDKTAKASMWRSRITLMLLYLLVLVVTGIVMYASYGGYEKLTVLDDQGQRTLMVFGDTSLTEQLSWDPTQSCGNDEEGLTRFFNDTRLGVFHGMLGPEGCVRVSVDAEADILVVYEMVEPQSVVSVHRNSSTVLDFLCEEAEYIVRVMAATAISANPIKYNVTVQSNTMATVASREEVVTANGGQTATRVNVAQGKGVLSPADDCPEIFVSDAPAGSVWEVSTVSATSEGAVIASGRGGSPSAAKLCLPSSGGEFRVRLYAGDTGANLMADLSTTCQMEIRSSGGDTTSTFTCGSATRQDSAVLRSQAAAASLSFEEPGSAACSSFTHTTGDGVSWWIISHTGQIIQDSSSLADTVHLCDVGVYEFSLAASTPAGSSTLQLGNLTRQLSSSGSDARNAIALFRVGTSAAFISPQQQCSDMALAFDQPSGTEGSSWELTPPMRFPQLLPAASPWPLPDLSGTESQDTMHRYLCQRGAYALRVTGTKTFRVAFDGDDTASRPCALTYCDYHSSCGDGGDVAEKSSGFLGSIQSAADSAWEGLGNEEGSLMLRVVDDEGEEFAVCGYQNVGKPEGSGGSPEETVYFAKAPLSNTTVLLPSDAPPDALRFSDQARQAAASAREEISMYCRPVGCQKTPPPAPSPPPSPPAGSSSSPLTDDASSSLFDIAAGGSSRQCYPLFCATGDGDEGGDEGEAVEYSCWETTLESTVLMSIVTLVAFILCPVAWFVIKLIGIKAEAQLNEQREAEEEGGGMCLFPCCFCMTCCGCTCGVGTLKVVKFAFTFGANAVLAINLSFAYDAANDQYIADLFAATTWLAYVTIAFMFVNICWGMCNVRDLFKSREALLEEDKKYASPEGWSPNMCCQLILGCFVVGCVSVGVFVWGAGAWSEYGHYSDDVAQMLKELDGATIGEVLKRLAMGIALIHPDFLQIPDLAPITLQFSMALTICLGPVVFVADLVSQLPWKLLAGMTSLKMRATKIAALPASAARAPGRSDVAQTLSDTQAKIGGKLESKDEAARKKQKDGKGLDDRLEAGLEQVTGQVNRVTGAVDRVNNFVESGVQGMVEENTVVEIMNDPLDYGEKKLKSRAKGKAESWAEENTLGKLDRGDEAAQEAARNRGYGSRKP